MAVLQTDPYKFMEAARAWLVLGSTDDAAAELDHLPPELQSRADVLLLRCEICERSQRWAELELTAHTAAVRYPDYRSFFVKWAWALYRQGATVEALELARNAAHCFPESASVAYLVACLYGALDLVRPACRWLSVALDYTDDFETLQARALEQPELQCLMLGSDPQLDHRSSQVQ